MSKLDNSLFKFVRRVFSNYLVTVAIILLALTTLILEPKFLSMQNISNIMSQLGALSLVSLGMTFVIIGGFIDLSVAGIINLVAVVTISLIQPLGQIPALIIGLCLGALLGWINSLLILKAGATTQADALFITFGMSTVYGALALLASGGSTQQMRWITSDTSVFQSIGSGSISIFTIAFIIFIVCLMLLHVFQSKTYLGRAISLTGGNKTAANLSGVPVNKSIMIIFTISGMMAALGAIVLFSRVTSASPVIGASYETNAILAVVVGGTTLKGGNGSVLRTLLGVILVTLLSNCMNLLGVSTYIQAVLGGVILKIAIWLDNRKELKGEY
jgi:ribose transport system permease protein